MKQRKKLFILMCFFFAGISGLYAQINVSGTVTDAKGEPQIGVNVIVKGSSRGTISDLNGMYQLTVPDNSSVLVFSYLGFEKQEQKVGDRKVVSVIMAENSKALDEVVVIGYAEVKRRDLTGSVSTVNLSDLEKAPVSTFGEALAGRVAGVNVSAGEGMPGQPMNIVIRGNNSITQDNSPLYVVDGFPIENLDPGTLSSSDIASMEVLKDASSTAIYGARGANGVIVITTKKGKAGAPQVAYEGRYGFQKMINSVKMMNGYEFVQFQQQTQLSSTMSGTYFKNGHTLEDYRNSGTDWQNAILQPAPTQRHSLSLTGGNADCRYNASLSYLDQTGIILNTGYLQTQGKIGLDAQLNKKLKVNLSINYSDGTVTGTLPSTDGNSAFSTSPLQSAMSYRPVSYDPNQDLLDMALDQEAGASTQYTFNPVLSLKNEYRKTYKTNLIANGFIQYEIINNLKLKVSGGVTTVNSRADSFNGSNTRTGYPTSTSGLGINASTSTNEKKGWLNENTLTYANTFDKAHTITALLGYTLQDEKSGSSVTSANHIPNDIYGMSGISQGLPSYAAYSRGEWVLISYLSRLNYNYMSKYYATASLRSDESSKFAPGYRTGTFLSGSLAWTISKEAFMTDLTAISNAKLRTSWGQTGNNRVSNYAYLSQVSQTWPSTSFDNTVVRSTAITVPGNPGLKWETTDQINAGLDLGLFKDRISMTVDVYNKTTRDLLLDATLPGTAGYGSIFKNVGKIENRGLEFSINTVNIKTKNFSWTSDFNISFNRNKVLELADNAESMQKNIYNATYIAKIGEPVGMMYGYIYDGTYKYSDFNSSRTALNLNVAAFNRDLVKPGDGKYRDVNGDGVINDYDKVVIGNGNPIHLGGFSNNITYSNFDLNVFFQWSYGNDILNYRKYATSTGGNTLTTTNRSAFYFYNRWTPDNPTSDIPRAEYMLDTYSSTYAIEDGSYLRLKTIQLGYSFPQKLLNFMSISKFRLFASAQNIYTWTHYSGGDPEVSTRAGALTPGFDNVSYPQSLSVNFGANITF